MAARPAKSPDNSRPSRVAASIFGLVSASQTARVTGRRRSRRAQLDYAPAAHGCATASVMLAALPVVSLLLLAPESVHVEDVGVTFELPDGWVDLSPGSVARQGMSASDLPREAQQAKVLAFDFAGATEEFAANLNVRVSSCPDLDEDSLVKIVDVMKKELAGIAEVVEIDRRLVTVDETQALRIEHDLVMPNAPRMRQLQYWMAAGKHCVIATYSAQPERWDVYESVFEASAGATTGLREPGLDYAGIFAAGCDGGAKGAAIGLAVGLVAGLFGWWQRRRTRRSMGTEAELP